MASNPPPLAALARRYVAPQWPRVVALAGLLVTGAAVQVVHPRLLAAFIDGAAAGDAVGTLARLAVAYLVLALVGQVVAVVDVYLAEHVALVATNELRTDLTGHLLRLDLAFHSSHRPGELIQRVDGDAGNLANFFGRFVVAVGGNLLLLAGVVVMIATVDLRLAAGVAAATVVVGLTVFRLRRVARPYWARVMEAQADHAGFLEEHLAATEDLRSSGATGYAMRRFFEQARALLHRQRQALFRASVLGVTSGTELRIATTAALGAAVWLFRRGDVSIGEVYLVFAYAQMLADPISVINRQVEDLQTAAAAVARLQQLLDAEPAIVGGAGAGAAWPSTGPLAVAIDGVTFRYGRDDERPVLDDVTVHVAPGRVLGLLGRTGSGKTTLARLLVRFHDPERGTVSVGGVDVRDATLHELRNAVGLVTQDVQLFHGSARDNLTMFDPSVPDDRVVAVLHDLGLDRWLAALPAGLDTLLAAEGAGLSAGEAQLLAFARVFLRDPRVVILDEATARLDPETEERVEHAVARLFEGRTAIVIAHRLGTVARADDVAILEAGRLVEHGARSRLVADPASRFSRLLQVGLEEAQP